MSVVADNQGGFKTCTRHALAKAICQGFMMGLFNGVKLNLLQPMVTVIMLAVHGVTQPMWPHQFNDVVLELIDSDTLSDWAVTIKDVKEVKKYIMINDLESR